MYLTSSSFSDSTTASPDSYQDPFPEDLESFWFDNSKPLCKTSTVKPPPPVPRPSRRKNSSGNRSSNNTSRSDRVLNSVCGRRSMNGSSNTSNVSTYSDEDSTADGSVDQFTNPKKRSNPFGEDTKDEARKARNRASAERSRQRRLMYTSSLEEKLSDVERKNKMLEMEKDNLENMIKAIASGQIQADQALALMKSSKDAQAIINTAANTETLLDDYLQIQPSHSIGAVNPHSNDFFAAQNNNSKQNQTHGGDMVNNDIDFHTIAQVISGSERSTLYNILLSWLSGNLMLIVLQMGLYLTMNQNMMIALKQIKNLKISSAPLMEKISMDGILRLVNEKVHKELTLNQVNGLVKNFVVNNMDDCQLRFLCNHKIK